MDDEHGPVPEDLKAVVDLLNTIDLEDGTDQLADKATFSAWLAGRIGAGPARRATVRDLENARAIRDALRALAAYNSGEPLAENIVASGSAALGELPINVQFVADGSAVAVGGKGVERYFGEIVASYARAQEQRRWERVKLCASPDCRWAYWDSSKNESRRWCAMGVCGSRSKMRAYRRRNQDHDVAGGSRAVR
jgi:predicted RNA-binding Zn ribbon-like protein